MRLKADLLLFMVAVIWGTAFVAQGIAGQYHIAYLFNGVSFMLAGVILIPFTCRQGTLRYQDQGQCEPEGRPLTGRAAQAHLSLLPFDQKFGDIQSQP